MKKKELIDYCNAIKENKSQIINCIDVNGIIKKIEQINESEKDLRKKQNSLKRLILIVKLILQQLYTMFQESALVII